MMGQESPSRFVYRPKLIYGIVFLLLAVITAIEISLSSPALGLSKGIVTAILLALSLGKASLVAAFFMHLRSDNSFYTYVFILPTLLLLIVAYLMVIS
jgi:caa(3)-type oxidase subunit IV